MVSTLTLLSLAATGFLGGGHCAGMCGGLSTAFALQLPPQVGRVKLIVLMNLGRLTSYSLIGLLLGGLGQFGISLDQTRLLQHGLSLAANLLLLLIGLYLAGLNAYAAQVEKLGRPVWRRLNPLLNRLLPIKNTPACFGVGVLWGWLPCGMVYSASLYALGSSRAADGALMMLAFGLGTLPNLLAMGLFASQIKPLLQHRLFRLFAGLSVSLWAAWQLWHGISGWLQAT
ncbi:sulfite exporter TauE/SafE family protein [Eikenella sp. S3360]|uniref:Sulfite exporter TauE/SafE family protein n=1 Tax=Eikenella glucosivorans TaxID=2766967 RepID=A0ABS0NAT0_9NEIS|nr:sulfite exporter TauE/SafE family protein [Eikenella glucosivorans]MBH5329389.1 sulfite exporter TauE/SafE family protein [Eikenella glucosivorans]